jgi:hypothetical protein
MELGFWNLRVTMTRRGRRLPNSGEGSLRERARRGDSSRNPEVFNGNPTTTTTTNP